MAILTVALLVLLYLVWPSLRLAVPKWKARRSSSSTSPAACTVGTRRMDMGHTGHGAHGAHGASGTAGTRGAWDVCRVAGGVQWVASGTRLYDGHSTATVSMTIVE